MIGALRRALTAYEDLVEPSFDAFEYAMPAFLGRSKIVGTEWLIHLALLPTGAISLVEVKDVVRDMRFRRSWLAPWRRYAFLDLMLERSDRNVLCHSPGMEVVEDGVTRMLSGHEVGHKLIDTLSGPPDPQPWFAVSAA